jgi:hypothetical protein
MVLLVAAERWRTKTIFLLQPGHRYQLKLAALILTNQAVTARLLILVLCTLKLAAHAAAILAVCGAAQVLMAVVTVVKAVADNLQVVAVALPDMLVMVGRVVFAAQQTALLVLEAVAAAAALGTVMVELVAVAVALACWAKVVAVVVVFQCLTKVALPTIPAVAAALAALKVEIQMFVPLLVLITTTALPGARMAVVVVDRHMAGKVPALAVPCVLSGPVHRVNSRQPAQAIFN